MSDTPPALVNQGWVVMYHPDLDGPDGHVYTEVTPEAFDLVWQAKGFVKAGGGTPAATADEEPSSASHWGGSTSTLGGDG